MSTIDARPPVQVSGRFRLLHESELAAPAKCVICGIVPSVIKPGDENRFITGTSQAEELTTAFTDEGESYLIDGRLDFEFYGTVYFCKNCTLEMAALYGGVQAERYEDLVRKYDALNNEHEFTLERCRELEGVRDSLSAELVRISGVGIIGNNSPQPPTPIETSEPQSIGSAVSPTTTNNFTAGEQSSSESAGIERSDDFSDLERGFNLEF